MAATEELGLVGFKETSTGGQEGSTRNWKLSISSHVCGQVKHSNPLIAVVDSRWSNRTKSSSSSCPRETKQSESVCVTSLSVNEETSTHRNNRREGESTPIEVMVVTSSAASLTAVHCGQVFHSSRAPRSISKCDPKSFPEITGRAGGGLEDSVWTGSVSRARTLRCCLFRRRAERNCLSFFQIKNISSLGAGLSPRCSD